MIKETIDLLGYRATDRITGFTGVISSVGFDLYGCVQGLLSPAADTGRKYEQSVWFDIQRLDVADERVMTPPDFDAGDRRPATYNSGAADKPAFAMPPIS